MLLNSTVQYSLVILNELKDKVEPIRAYEIVSKHNLSANFVDQICRRLRDEGLIKSFRGPGGGYILTEKGKTLNLFDVITIFSKWKTEVSHEAAATYINQVKNALIDIQI
jgi:Rrf2 family transcriptional regulator, iron-sulfur cluster assembly transcription factor